MLDEISANVDPYLKRNIWNALSKYREITHCSIILTSHDSAEMLNVADRILFLQDGEIKIDGTFTEIYKGVDKLIIDCKSKDVSIIQSLLNIK